MLKIKSDELVQVLKDRKEFTPERFKLELQKLIPFIEQSVN